MGKWTRAELEEAFENYQQLALEAEPGNPRGSTMLSQEFY